jgi:hypothetical protein
LKAGSQEARVATTEKANKAAERLARTTGDSYRTVIDHTVALQERNAKFWQGMIYGVVREVRGQAESNRAVTQELVERAEGQRDAFRTLIEESVDAYVELIYAPLVYYRRGLRLVESGVNGGFPIPGYDELNVAEISQRLDGLTAAQIREVREYEKRNKNRETLIEQLDRKRKAASAEAEAANGSTMTAGGIPGSLRLSTSSPGYLRRSFRWPFFFFMVPRRWSERPSAFFARSPLRAPAASFTRPLALSIAPSCLSSRPVVRLLPI